MKTITLTSCLDNIDHYIQEAKGGKIFVYPTNTIYGIGGIVNEAVITQINAAKSRLSGKHYSIIAPDFTWIQDNCLVEEDIQQEREELRKRYGAITLLLPKKETYTQAHLLSDNNLIGVRHLGNHPFQSFVQQLQEPFITTSANISGQANITDPLFIQEEQKAHIDYVIDAGVLDNSASTIINYRSKEILSR